MSSSRAGAKPVVKDKNPRAATTPKAQSPRTGIPKPGTKLPSVGAPGKGPTGTRSPSNTNLKPSKIPRETGTPQTVIKKERSFVEKDFQETVTRSEKRSEELSTPVTASAAAFSPSEKLEEKVPQAQTQQESKDAIRDLEEKLETLKIKRAKDQEKLKEFEKMCIQHEQLLEFKSRIMASQAHLQKELQKAKHDAREAIEAKEKHAEEMSELSETVEMATLDKEMAEEKAEALQIELDAAKEKIEELTLDLDIIKAEMGDGDSKDEERVTNYEMKQQLAQNEKLRETLVRMRDLLAHEKNVNIKALKDLEEATTRNSELTKANKKLADQNASLESTIFDIQEQVDVALGAEEMVENLTTKCLDMEDKLAKVEEEKEDLEKLHDLNEELQENAREVELQLREDLEMSQAKIRELIRGRDAAYEIIADHEKTIKNFRDHVKKVQEQNADLRATLEKETNKPLSTPAEMMSFKMMFEESKAQSRAIDLELRLCEERQAKQHVTYLSMYMSDSFMMRGGDNEAVMMLLLIPRMIWKADILISQAKENFKMQGDIDKDALLKGHNVEMAMFGNQMIHFLEALVAQLNEFSSAMSTCSPETFLRVGTLYPEMCVHERAVDFYIDLLRKNQLDETVPIDNLEKGLQYFQNIYPLHLGSEKIDHPTFLRSHLKALLSAIEALLVELQVGQLLLAPDQASSEIGTLLKTAAAEIGQLKQMAKAMKRRLPIDETHPALVVFPSSVAKKLSDVVKSLTPLVKAMHIFGKNAAQQAGLQGEAELSATKLSELLHQAIDKVYQFNETGLETVRSTVGSATNMLAELNKMYLDGEWDVETLPAKPIPPLELRAEAYKAEVKEAQSMKHKLEQKDADIKDMKLLLRSKGEELSEMQVRKDKADKKLLDASKDSELMREKLQRKVDDLQELLKKKEKDFEVTMEHLQSDIDQLEGEKGELKEKIKDITKQTLFKEMNKKMNTGQMVIGASGPTSLGPSIPKPVMDSPLLLQQLEAMKMALLTARKNTFERETADLRRRMENFKPLAVPKSSIRSHPAEKQDVSKDESPDLTQLLRRAQRLEVDISNRLTTPRVVDLKQRTGPAQALSYSIQQQEISRQLQMEVEQMQHEVARLKASKRLGGRQHVLPHLIATS